jgi:spore coat polysaccharide biosynthesis predicted glycosyltransferase SpsG
LELPINLKILEGSKYALLGSEYLDLPNREPRQSANRVLITCGGSDTKGYTLEILRGLDGIALSLEIRVVLGPMFNEQLCSLVELHAMESHHKILTIKNSSSILDGMLWCDLAISANGLTKYELAASGTPSIQFSIDEHHSYANLEFSKKNTAIDVGVGIDKKIIAREVSAALSSEKLRGEMIQAGKYLVDGAGVERLLNEIMRSYFAKK